MTSLQHQGDPTATNTSKPPVRPGSGLRDTAETIVFVVVLVLILRLFLLEFFQIPTGSMATTLLGNHVSVTCPQCDYPFPVGLSNDEGHGTPDGLAGATCPNCRYFIDFQQTSRPPYAAGDRVAVAKFLYDTGLRKPARQEVVVFKYPEEPSQKYETINYIKRLIGEPGETIGIHYGDLYIYPAAESSSLYRNRPSPPNPEEARKPDFMYKNDREALSLFSQGKFEIVRKPPAQVLSMRRIVYNNDYQARDLTQSGFPPRWAPEKEDAHNETASDFWHRRQAAQQGAWQPEVALGFRHAPKQGSLDWLRYRHLLAPRSADEAHHPELSHESIKPQLITDFMAYNSWHAMGPAAYPTNWVGDLILECEATIERPQGELVMELSKGADRFQARWDLATGDCALVRLSGNGEEVLDRKPTKLRDSGIYSLRFANVDERLMIWVNRSMPFGDGVAYPPAQQPGPTENDLEPAAIAVRDAGVVVTKLKLWRDTYYTLQPGKADPQGIPDWSSPATWKPLRELLAETLYVQPGHYLCLGDNSLESADSRNWGLVPRRLLQGRALAVYFPLPPRPIE